VARPAQGGTASLRLAWALPCRFAVYTYPGAGTITRVAHPAVSGGLTLTYGSNGDYAGWARLARPPKGEKAECPLLPPKPGPRPAGGR